MIDLHTHSTASDGSLPPKDLIQAASQRGLTAIALTDHDTIAGLEAARQEAAALGVGFIPGIEIEITWEPGEFHLLGLGIRQPSPGFSQAIAELGQLREDRNHEIVRKMQSAGIAVRYADILEIAGGPCVGRPHFASLLVNRGIVKTREQAFRRYLGKGREFYAPKEGLDFSRGVEIIKESGGIPVLAHPMSLYLAWGRLPGFIKDLRDQGLAGIEAWHPLTKVHNCKRLETLGKSLGLFITAGSDYHGESRPDRKLGLTAGGRKIDDSFLAPLADLFFK